MKFERLREKKLSEAYLHTLAKPTHNTVESKGGIVLKLVQKQWLAAGLSFVLTAAVMGPVLAFGRPQEVTSQPEVGRPIAQVIEGKTYRNIPYHAQFLSVDNEGDPVTYSIAKPPKHGKVEVDGNSFVYTPDKNRTGSDTFSYVASDTDGHTSKPASVSVRVQRTRSGVSYADTAGNQVAAAAQCLAEEGIFVGNKIGDQYYFEPDRPVSRNEFLAMVLETAGTDPNEVTMTGFCDDAAIPAWGKSYASTGVTEGLIRGVSTEEGVAFQPERTITYNQAATILDRALAVRDAAPEVWFADRTAVPSWAAQAVSNMESVHVMKVGSFGSDQLNEPVTRGEAAEMLSSAHTLLEGENTSWLDRLTD